MKINLKFFSPNTEKKQKEKTKEGFISQELTY